MANEKTQLEKSVRLNDQQNPVSLDLICLWKARKYLIVPLLIGLTGLPLGWDVGTIGGLANMPQFKQAFATQINGTYQFNPWILGLIIASTNIGSVLGGLCFGGMGDFIGYKRAILWTFSIYIVATVVELLSCFLSIWYWLLLGRILTGVCIGSFCVLGPILIKDSSLGEYRGLAVSFQQNLCCSGILLGNIVVYITSTFFPSSIWSVLTPILCKFLIAIINVVGLWGVPESARFYVNHGLPENAKESIAKTHNHSTESNLVLLELEKIGNYLLTNNNATSNVFSLFGRRYLKRTLSSISVMTFQQLTGVNYFFYYSNMLFLSVGLENSYITAIILGAVNCAASPFGGLFMEKFGRKICLIWGSIIMALCMVIYASIGITLISNIPITSEASARAGGIIMIFFTSLHIATFATTWGPAAFVVVSEISNGQSLIMANASAANNIVNFLITLLTPVITKSIGYAYGFVFAGCLLTSGIFVHFFLPETKGLSMEDIDDYYASQERDVEVGRFLEIEMQDLSIRRKSVSGESAIKKQNIPPTNG